MRMSPVQTHFNAAQDESPLTQVGDTGLVELYGLEVSNPDAVDAHIQFFDAVAASDVTLGTTAPKASYLIAAQIAASKRGKCEKQFTHPIMFTLGCWYAITTTPTGNTGTASDLPVNINFRRQRNGE